MCVLARLPAQQNLSSPSSSPSAIAYSLFLQEPFDYPDYGIVTIRALQVCCCCSNPTLRISARP